MLNFKKWLAFLLALTLLLSIIPFSTLSAAEETVKTGYIFETNVNIRKDATTSSDKLDNVSKLNVTVLGSKNDTKSTKNPDTNKTYVWYKISYVSGSKTITGYVREDLIKVTEVTVDTTFEEQLAAFPKSYHKDLSLLHALYPNWKFIADEVDTKFSSAVAAQDKDTRKLVETTYNSWRSMRKGSYDWEKGKFITADKLRYGASREVIAYYMDPRNFLNANDIYIFMQQSYDSKTQTVAGIEKIVDGTFLDAKITDKKDKYYGKRYAAVIRYAGSKSGVNAYVLAATILQEQGIKGTALTKGTTYSGKKVYNFFNYMASGSSTSAIINNGTKYAYSQKWYTPTDAIVSGAKKYGSGYISEGQDTFFYKNFNVHNPDKLNHQYAQSVNDSLKSAIKVRETYSELSNIALTFRIPVFKSMPEKASKLPKKSSKYNNYYFENLKGEGITKFSRFTTKYTLSAKGDFRIAYTLPEGASYVGEEQYAIKKGENTVKLKVKSETGYTRSYTLTITATKDCTLSVCPAGETLVKHEDGNWYYYLDGVQTAATTLVKYSGKWFYVKDGVWCKETTLVKYNNKWFYVENGKWTSKPQTLFKFNDVWFYINGGKWDNTAKTLVEYKDKLFYVKSGKWAKETLIFKHNGKRYYVKSGIVQTDFTGSKKINGTTYKIKNGIVV